MHFAAGLEPQLSAQVLGNQNLPLLGELGYGHKFFLRLKESVPRAQNVGKRDDQSISSTLPFLPRTPGTRKGDRLIFTWTGGSEKVEVGAALKCDGAEKEGG
jgi:hypothetical protein